MTAKILIVDDVAVNVRLLAAKLKAEYYQVSSTSNGFSAIEEAASWHPDLIILDVMMPGMDGFECCQRLKGDERTKHIPVIMLTALGELPERIRGLEFGADDFLTKPIDHATLMIRVKSLVRLKRILDEWQARSNTAAGFGVEFQQVTSDVLLERVVIVISESVELRSTFQTSLSNCRVRFVTSLAEVNERPDMIVVGLSAQQLDPLEVISQIRSEVRNQAVPVLAILDPLTDRRQLIKAFELGASDWILSPVDPDELTVRCRNLLKRKLYQDKLQGHIDQAIKSVAIDPLTGLYNRRYLIRHLTSLLSESAERELSILMIDIDHFKSINDRFGHIFGDTVISLISKVLLSNLRSFDTCSRYGGEEFVILLPRTGRFEACEIGKRLLREVKALENQFGSVANVSLSVSIGVAANVASNHSSNELLRAADEALYKAKCLGRNRMEVGFIS